jgi:hypothetical protein
MIHVKSHQDEGTPFEDLPLSAQLNCLADTLAGDYLKDYQEDDQSKVLRMPVNRAQLHIPEGTLTYKLPQTIRNRRTEPPLLAKMMRDNHAWSADTVGTIDLQVHGRAVN